MAKIPVAHVKAGMVVREPVTDRHGRMLIPEGTELSERHVGALAMWGVPVVDIEGVEAENELESIPPEVVEQARADVDERFGLVDRTHPLMEGLYEIALTRCAQRLARTAANGASRA